MKLNLNKMVKILKMNKIKEKIKFMIQKSRNLALANKWKQISITIADASCASIETNEK